MATAETVQMGPVHPPKEESIKVFNEIEVDLKKTLQHLRHSTDSKSPIRSHLFSSPQGPPNQINTPPPEHEPEYFYAVKNLSDAQLTNFSSDDLKEVRVATSAYGLHIFGKVLLPDSDMTHAYPERPGDAYFMFRAFVAGDAETAKLHCIHMEEIEKPDGDKVFKAIFSQKDPLEWFDV